MGNKVSSDKSFGDIYILLSKGKYIAGEQVNGTVNVSLVKAFPARELYLIIQGKEKTKVIYQTTTKRRAFYWTIIGMGKTHVVLVLNEYGCVFGM